MGLSFKGGIAPVGAFKVVTNIPPIWGTTEGSLGAANGGQPYTLNLLVSDPENAPLMLTVISGSLPAGLSIAGTIISGTPVNIPGVYSFTIRCFDGYSSTDRSFQLEVTNQTPVWVTAAGSLGTFTVGMSSSITLQATDPNNDQITYTVVSGDLPSGITLVNGIISGTPLLVETANFTIRASDGKGGNVDRAFSMTVQAANDTNIGSVSTLVHFDGSPTDTYLRDDRWYGKTIEWSNGGPTIVDGGLAGGKGARLYSGTFTNGYVGYSATSRYDLRVGASDWTIEGHFTFFSTPEAWSSIITQWTLDNQNSPFQFDLNGNNLYLGAAGPSGSHGQVCNYPITWQMNRRYHLAATRQGSTWRIFIDGVLVTSGTFSGSVYSAKETGTILLSGNSSNANLLINDFRIYIGVAKYTGNFTAPSTIQPIGSSDPNWQHCRLCLPFTDDLNDQSSADVALYGNAVVDTSSTKYGTASLKFDGTGDYAQYKNLRPVMYSFGTGNFTIEGWVKINGWAKSYNGNRRSIMVSCAKQMGTDYGWTFYIYNQQVGDDPNSGQVNINFMYVKNNGGLQWAGLGCTEPPTIKLGEWHHYAACRYNGSFYLFIDGVLQPTGSNNVTPSDEVIGKNELLLGSELYPSWESELNGNIDELRITKGVARYTSSFVPSGPYPNV
jgi:hypothetical protein